MPNKYSTASERQKEFKIRESDKVRVLIYATFLSLLLIINNILTVFLVAFLLGLFTWQQLKSVDSGDLVGESAREEQTIPNSWLNAVKIWGSARRDGSIYMNKSSLRLQRIFYYHLSWRRCHSHVRAPSAESSVLISICVPTPQHDHHDTRHQTFISTTDITQHQSCINQDLVGRFLQHHSCIKESQTSSDEPPSPFGWTSTTV